MLVASVNIDDKSGFCFGVVYAIEMAETVLSYEEKLYCLGQIVHNDEEVRRLTAKGLRIITHDDLMHLRDEKVLIRAHGEPPSTYEIAHRNNLTLLDASCPVVLKLQHAVQEAHSRKENIYIYGKPGHPEVIALLGQISGKARVFQSIEELDLSTLPKEITLYSQTTKSVQPFYDAIRRLREAGISVQVRDTICRQVSNREREVRSFATKFDKIVFVSGKQSSNGRALYNTCKKSNTQSFFVSSVEEVHRNWFNKGDHVGVCGATSTPRWLMESVQKHILSL